MIRDAEKGSVTQFRECISSRMEVDSYLKQSVVDATLSIRSDDQFLFASSGKITTHLEGNRSKC